VTSPFEWSSKNDTTVLLPPLNARGDRPGMGVVIAAVIVFV
jgi:hypothetical protein